MTTEILPTRSPAELAHAVDRATEWLVAGEPVALPTETVYGLAANALQPAAVLKIFSAKERPFFDPLIVHLPNREWLDRVTDIPPESRDLVDALVTRFWPGPLTLVLPRRAVVPDVVTAGLESVAVRISAHRVFRAVIDRFAQPLAAPSANRFGRISPTAAEHVLAELGERIPLVVDGGATEHGIESTIVKVTGGELQMLRAGPITAEEIGAAFFQEKSQPLLRGIEAPGQLESHYAPRTPLQLIDRGTHVRLDGKVGSLAFREPSSAGEFACEQILSPTGDLRVAAATLFAKLRRLDEAGLDLILAEPVPEHGLGIAIMDRLRKAAGRG